MSRILDQLTLDDQSFWKGKGAELPKYDRKTLPVKALCFSAGRMAYGHTGDILQDLLNQGDADGTMVGIETFAQRYVAELAASDYLMTQLIYENEKGKVVPKVQGAITNVLFVDAEKCELRRHVKMPPAAGYSSPCTPSTMERPTRIHSQLRFR